MTDTIKPALSVKNWAEGRYLGMEIAVSNYGIPPQVSLEFYEGNPITNPDDLHAVAALALYGQQFGFENADVKYLREVVQAIDTAVTAHDLFIALGALDAERGRSLADRIEALLPPE